MRGPILVPVLATVLSTVSALPPMTPKPDSTPLTHLPDGPPASAVDWHVETLAVGSDGSSIPKDHQVPPCSKDNEEFPCRIDPVYPEADGVETHPGDFSTEGSRIQTISTSTTWSITEPSVWVPTPTFDIPSNPAEDYFSESQNEMFWALADNQLSGPDGRGSQQGGRSGGAYGGYEKEDPFSFIVQLKVKVDPERCQAKVDSPNSKVKQVSFADCSAEGLKLSWEIEQDDFAPYMDGQNDYPKEQDDYPMDRGEWQPEPDYGSSDYGRNNYGDDGLDCYDDNYNPYCPCSSDDYKCDLPRCQCSPDDECYRPPRCQCSPDDECYRPPRCQCSPDDEYDRPPRCQCSPEDDKCPKCPTCPKCKNCKGRFRSGLFPDACFKQVADGGNDDSFAVSPEECHEVCDMMNGPRESDFSWVDCDEVCDESLPYPLSLNAIASARGGHGSAASNPFFGGGQSSSSRYGDYRNPSYDYRWGDDRNGGSSYDHRWGDDCNGGRCYGYEKHESSSYEYPPSGSPSYGDQGYGDDQYDSNRGGWEPPYPPQKNKGKWVFVLNGFRPQKYQDNYPQGGGGYGKGKGGYH